MKEKKTISKALAEEGLVDLKHFFSNEQINFWNSLLDPFFKKHESEDKIYTSVNDLYEIGLLNDLFANKKLRHYIKEIMPDAVLQSIYALETTGEKKESHVVGSHLWDGWHNDLSSNVTVSKDLPHYVIIMIYLSDVENQHDGAFEFVPYSCSHYPPNKAKSSIILGPKGSTFAFNKFFTHRACPNTSKKRRRVLSLTIQNNFLQNKFLWREDVKNLQQIYQEDPFLSFLWGAEHAESNKGGTLPDTAPYSIEYWSPTHNSLVSMSKSAVIAKKIKNKLRLKLSL